MKKGTSIQYQLSNVYLFNFIYGQWGEFMKIFHEGPEAMKEFLFNKWNELKEKLTSKEDFEIWDKEKLVKKDDFEMALRKTSKGINVFYINFPYTEAAAASVCVAIVMTPNMPRYFTMEYSNTMADLVEQLGEDRVIEMYGRDVYEERKNKAEYVLGEFVLTNEGRIHKNRGYIPNKTVSNFVQRVEEIVDNEI